MTKTKITIARLAVGSALLLSMLVAAPVALAQNATSSANASATSTEKRDTAKAQIRERALAHILEVAQRIAKRLKDTIDRLANIADRLGSRITKLKGEGVDTTTPEAKLKTATDKILAAQQSWNDLNNAFATAFNASTTRENMKKARDLIAPTTKLVKDAHKALVDALVATMKAAGQSHATSTATTTASTTNSN